MRDATTYTPYTMLYLALLFLSVGCDQDQVDSRSDVGDLSEDRVADSADSAGEADLASDVVEETEPRSYPEPPSRLGGDRPAAYFLPAEYEPNRAWPLVVLLHGYGASGAAQDLYLGLSDQVDAYGFVAIVPDGTMNSQGQRFWNGSDACCDFENTGVDDVAYLTALMDEAAEYFRVDPGRTYLIGHSNGGFMAHRFACESGERVAGIVSLAGAIDADAVDCPALTPVSVLQVHGTQDGTIEYEGSSAGSFGRYPSATTSASLWAGYNRCGDPIVGEPFDIDAAVDGAETTPTTWTDCRDDVAVALWTLEGGGHLPGFSDRAFIRRALHWLFEGP